MVNIFIVLIVLVGFFFLIQRYVLKTEEDGSHRYRLNKAILNPNEVAFLNALKAAVGEQAVILAKVNMLNVVNANETANKKQRFIATNRISRLYFDFLVCDPRTLQPRVVIELDNGKPLDKQKVERETVLIKVCKSANLPLIGASVKHSYQVSRLRRLLAAHIDLIEEDKEIRFCKKCGSPMVIRVASQGEFKGRRFFTCSRQPHCRYTENYNVVYESERENRQVDVDDLWQE
ncbi:MULTISPECIES: DUF2726 domain-containing protein [unclassified Vibrio]|uniref:DUF2726 domain-containing protein n=1 Tax=Vibrio sp. HB236076 TaxID=3232307 RepID=A0AB39H7T4_9VIBR|nr:DUF2726 domain-containing protein [Vibrio sp. HB161653]MDP5253462.1 DUF2726 domain-containing protein [Vibrio sp. HB161653]